MSRAQQIRDLIEQNHEIIADAEREIGKLSTQYDSRWTGKIPYQIYSEIPEKVADLRDKIKRRKAANETLTAQLPMIEASETVVANANAKAEAAERDRQAKHIAERDTNMKEAARADYLASGGDPAQFEGAWPSIQHEIATQNATAAAEGALAAPTNGDQMRVSVKEYLALRYRQPERGGQDARQN